MMQDIGLIRCCLPLLFTVSLVFAVDESNITRVSPPLVNKTFYISVDASYSMLSRSIASNDNKVSSKINDVLYANMFLTLFPDTYSLQLHYATNLSNNVDEGLYNPLGFDKSVQHLEVSMIPWYDQDYGGIATFYNFTQQNSYYKNLTASPMVVGKYAWDSPAHNFWVLQTLATLAAGEAIQFKEEASYLGLKYLLPQSRFLPKGTNIYYATMDRTMLYYATLAGVDKLVYVSGKGMLYGLGIQRALSALPFNRFSLHLIQVSRGQFTGFPTVNLSEYTAGLTYKTQYWYLQFVTLIYIAHEFRGYIGADPLFIPQQTDIFSSLHLGASF